MGFRTRPKQILASRAGRRCCALRITLRRRDSGDLSSHGCPRIETHSFQVVDAAADRAPERKRSPRRDQTRVSSKTPARTAILSDESRCAELAGQPWQQIVDRDDSHQVYHLVHNRRCCACRPDAETTARGCTGGGSLKPRARPLRLGLKVGRHRTHLRNTQVLSDAVHDSDVAHVGLERRQLLQYVLRMLSCQTWKIG